MCCPVVGEFVHVGGPSRVPAPALLSLAHMAAVCTAASCKLASVENRSTPFVPSSACTQPWRPHSCDMLAYGQ